MRPKVEQKITEGTMPWRAGGIGRGEAGQIATLEGRPVYGGTPTDHSVIEAIRALQRAVQLGEDRETPRYLYALGAAQVRAGDREAGRRHLEEARERARRLQLAELVQSIDRDLARLATP